MPADLDELLARAERLEEEQLPTREELMRELEDGLDELERRWPQGDPGDDDPWKALAYRTVLLEIGNARMQLEGDEGVDYLVQPRPSLFVVSRGRDDAS